MATIKDVAARAGVSIFTVSVVLNNKKRTTPEVAARVRKAATELNYAVNEVARSLQARRTSTVGMSIPDMNNPYYAQVVKGVEDRLRAEGYTLLITSTYDQAPEQERAISTFVARQVDGLILFATAGDPRKLRKIMSGKPAVFVSRQFPGLDGDTVMPDMVTGTKEAVGWLLAKGHRRVGLINGPSTLSTNQDRVKGWKAAFQGAKMRVASDWLVETDWSPEAGEAAAARLLASKQPVTAIVAATFPLLTGVLRHLHGTGRHDVALFTCDDYDWLDVFSPAVSGIAQPRLKLGTTAAELLLRRLAKPQSAAETVVLPCALRTRA